MNRKTNWRERAGRALRATVTAAALLLATGAARGQTCTFNTVSGVAFGSYDALSASPLDQTGSIIFQCTGLGAGTVTLDLSAGISGSFSARGMRKGADSLQYNLYRDASMTQVWGDGTGGTFHFGPFAPADGVAETVTIYGRMPARQASPVGAYTDTVTATINF